MPTLGSTTTAWRTLACTGEVHVSSRISCLWPTGRTASRTSNDRLGGERRRRLEQNLLSLTFSLAKRPQPHVRFLYIFDHRFYLRIRHFQAAENYAKASGYPELNRDRRDGGRPSFQVHSCFTLFRTAPCRPGLRAGSFFGIRLYWCRLRPSHRLGRQGTVLERQKPTSESLIVRQLLGTSGLRAGGPLVQSA